VGSLMKRVIRVQQRDQNVDVKQSAHE
jgi:hypothetical protein